jgi:hypothetical protein
VQIVDQNGSELGAGAAALEAFCALALDDAVLQAELRQPVGSDQDFIARVLHAARRRGFAFGLEDAQRVMRARMLAGVVEIAVKETPPPPDGWLPVRASWQDGALYAHWTYFGARRLREPFFEGDVRRTFNEPLNRLLGHVTAIEKLAAWLAERSHLKPSGFIFHMSRCGSTLVSQMLAALDSNIVVSEASPIDTVVQARHWRPDLDVERHSRWLAAMIGALGQKRCGDERRYFIKLDCWHTLALPLFRRTFPDVPWVFLYRNPIEVMVSQLRMPGRQMVPQDVGPDLYGVDRAYGPGTAENYYAQVLAKICEAAVTHYREGGGLLVNYRQLPDALFSAVLPHFGVACSDAERAVMAAAARFDAKAPGFEFAPDGKAKQQAASPAARAATERWLNDVYDRIERLRTVPVGAAEILEQS